MKLRRILSSVIAGAIAVAAMTFSASADLVVVDGDGHFISEKQMWLPIVYSDGTFDADTKAVTNYGIDCTKIASIDVVIEPADPNTFGGDFGGAVILSSKSLENQTHNWNAKEFWGVEDVDNGIFSLNADAPVQFAPVGDGSYKATMTVDDTNCVFDDYQFVQVAVQVWGGADKVKITSMVLKDASGAELISYDAAGKASLSLVEDDAAAEEETTEEDAAEEETTEEDAAEEETTEEDVAEDDAAEEEAEDDAAAEEETEEDAAEDDEAALEPDWDSYDADAMAKMNEEFVLGGNIDIYAAVGDAWADIAKIEADFIWTPGLGGWCGGAGIGNGATLADGTAWISGPEYGAANANSKYEPDGKATQTLIDLSATPLATIATVGEDGVTAFGQLMVQNWWNGTEAGAQVAAIRFLDADGNVINELTYAVDAPAADDTTTEAPATGDVDAETDSSKGSPDTGVEDVAVVAGLAIVAAGAVLVSKKRK